MPAATHRQTRPLGATELDQTRPRTHGRAIARLVAVLASAALVLSACGTIEDDDTIAIARATWDSGHMQAAIYAQLLTELGYSVTEPAEHTLDPNGFYPALGNGQYDLWANGWFPIHDIYLDAERVTGQSVELPIEPVGYQVRSGALQGYMIDKTTADSMGITSMHQLADPSVAEVFDHDDDGLADLIGCNEGWGCNSVIDGHIAELDWGGNVEQVVGDYGELMTDVQSSIAAGEPALFYAWTPNWTYEALRPGVDAVWLESSASEDDEGFTLVDGLEGCAADPCNLGWAVSSIRAVANEDFLDDHPDVRRLLEVVTVPLADIATQNALMAAAERGYTEEQINADAAKWIADNRETVDGWLEAARG